MSDPSREEPPPQRPVVGDLAAEKAVVAGELHVAGDFYMGAAPPRPRPTLKPPRDLPERNKRFVGRKPQLSDIHRLLQQEGEVGITQEVAVHAHGGIGKTALAVEYAWGHLADYPAGLFFISCDADLLLPAVAALAGPLGIGEGETPEQTAAWVKTWLESGEAGGPALLILDNVRDARQWNDAQWHKWLPGGQNCRRLITTRDDHLSLERYRLERLPQAEGVKLLAKYRKVARNEKQTVGQLVEWFDGLAVGLTVVGAYMADHPGLGWAGYIADLEAKGLGAVRATEEEVGGLPDYDRRIDAVFEDLLEALPPEHRRGLQYAALLPEDCVLPLWLVWLLENDEEIELPELPGYAGDPSRPVTDRLTERDLLRVFRGDDARLSLHRVLRRRLVELLAGEPDHRGTLLENLCALAEYRGEASHDAITRPQLRDELTPLLRLSDALLRLGRIDEAARLANWIHAPLFDLARTAEGRDSLERFIDAPLAPIEKATTLSNLATISRAQGDLPGAREQMQRAIAINEEHFPEDHPSLAIRYSNLALILKDQGDLPGARQQMERAIAIEQQHFPEDHPSLAISYNNLGHIELAEDRPQQARELFRRAHAILTKHFTAEHPKVQRVARTLKELGDLPEEP